MRELGGPSSAPGPKTAGLARDPLVLLAALAVVAGLGFGLHRAGLPLHPAQQLTAALFVLLAASAVVAAPANGLVLLYLVPPLFNGEDGRPYFFLLEGLVSLTILAGAAARLRPGGWRPVPGAALAALVVASAVLAVPVDLKAIGLEVSRTSWREVLEELRRSDVYGPLFYVRTVLNVASGVALYALAATERWPRATLVRLATATTLVYLAVTALGLWHFWLPVSPGKFMTVAYGWTHLQGGFVGLGFSVTFFGQYALAYLPLALLLLLEPAPRWARTAAVLAVAVTPYTVLSTRQKAAYVVFAVELGLLLVLGIALARQARPRARHTLAALVAAALAVGGGLLWLTPVGARVGSRLREFAEQGDPYRIKALDAAARMFLDHPVLGVGTGRYAALFPAYDADPGMQWGTLSAHNLYAQLLAEQGLAGLLSFVGLLGVVLGAALALGRRREADGMPALVLLVSLGAWLVYGLFQQTMFMRSMQAYCWITLGILASLAAAGRPARRVRWGWVLALVAAGLVAAGFRAHAALSRPLRPGDALGVYAVEPGGVRWTRGEATFLTTVQGTTLSLAVTSPFVGLVGRPQTVEMRLDGIPVATLVLRTGEPAALALPVDRPRGSPLTLTIRPDYTVVPATLGLGGDARRLGVLVRVQWVGGPLVGSARPRHT